jgi:hypothetical protein
MMNGDLRKKSVLKYSSFKIVPFAFKRFRTPQTVIGSLNSLMAGIRAAHGFCFIKPQLKFNFRCFLIKCYKLAAYILREACSNEFSNDSRQRKFGEISKILNNFLKNLNFCRPTFWLFGCENKKVAFTQRDECPQREMSYQQF